MKRVCIVGTGPAGMYSAKYLLRSLANVKLDLLERFPVPFGLVRFGVAPDHPEVKTCQEEFSQVFLDPRVRYFGNLTVNRDCSLAELQSMYDAVLLAHGPADSDKHLGLAKESDYVVGAREFVNWYNGFPWPGGMDFASKLKTTKSVVIIGNGNVALDCARILLTNLAQLKETDISNRALEGLATSTVQRVTIVGRRGPHQASFTMKELRELTKLPGVQFRVEESELPKTAGEHLARPTKRIHDLLWKSTTLPLQAKQVQLRFCLSPKELISNEQEGLAAVRFNQTSVDPSGAFVSTGQTEDLSCQLVIRSVGYDCTSLLGGKAPYSTTKLSTGLYSVGWCKRGPLGIIGTNVTDAHDTVNEMVRDQEEWMAGKENRRDLLDVCMEKRLPIVTWEGWEKIDRAERKRGSACLPPRPRVKIECIEEMLSLAKG